MITYIISSLYIYTFSRICIYFIYNLLPDDQVPSHTNQGICDTTMNDFTKYRHVH